MYQYKFVRLDVNSGFLTRQPSQDYHEIIHEHAKDGWRLVRESFLAPILVGIPSRKWRKLRNVPGNGARWDARASTEPPASTGGSCWRTSYGEVQRRRRSAAVNPPRLSNVNEPGSGTQLK